MDQENLEKIKKITQEFFNKTNLDLELKISSVQENTVPIQIKTEDPRALIGQNGQTLTEIQRLLKAVLRKNIPENFYIDLDVNNYKQKKKEYLIELARQTANDVALNKKEKPLNSMPAYERRIVHLELASREDVETDSVGEEPERKVIIRPRLS